jgi:predicted nucleotidyltransferase
MKQNRIQVPPDKIADFCQRHHIRKLSLFGSILRDDFAPPISSADSDIDVLVESEPEHMPGLAFARIQDELPALLGGREVDLVTSKFLNRRIRDRVLGEAVVQYEQAG